MCWSHVTLTFLMVPEDSTFKVIVLLVAHRHEEGARGWGLMGILHTTISTMEGSRKQRCTNHVLFWILVLTLSSVSEDGAAHEADGEQGEEVIGQSSSRLQLPGLWLQWSSMTRPCPQFWFWRCRWYPRTRGRGWSSYPLLSYPSTKICMPRPAIETEYWAGCYNRTGYSHPPAKIRRCHVAGWEGCCDRFRNWPVNQHGDLLTLPCPGSRPWRRQWSPLRGEEIAEQAAKLGTKVLLVNWHRDVGTMLRRRQGGKPLVEDSEERVVVIMRTELVPYRHSIRPFSRWGVAKYLYAMISIDSMTKITTTNPSLSWIFAFTLSRTQHRDGLVR